MMASRTDGWSDLHIDILTERWSTRTASEIGVMVNKTKNAVIGKAARLALPRKKDASVRTGRPKTAVPKEVKVRVHRATRPSRARMVVQSVAKPQPIEGGVHIMDLKNHHCRAVVGRGYPDLLARYCGAHKKDGSSFCEPHHAIYYNPPIVLNAKH